jgi:hypothetical protein
MSIHTAEEEKMKVKLVALILSAFGFASAAGTINNVDILSVSHLGGEIFLYLKDFTPTSSAQCNCSSHTWDTDSQLTGGPVYYVRWSQTDARSNQFLSIALMALTNGKKIKANFGNSQFIDNLFMLP